MISGKHCDIAADFVHGKGPQCGDFVAIGKNVVVGDDAVIASFVVLHEGARIGDRVRIEGFAQVKSGTILGSGWVVEDHATVQSQSRIGADTKIGTYCKVGRHAVIGENCRFTAFCEIRDDCQVGNRVSMGSRGTLSAGTRVEDQVAMKYSFVVTDTPVIAHDEVKRVGVLKRGSRFGANVTIMPGVTVGENSEIGACSQVRHDVPDNEVWYGNPARFFRKVNS